MGRTERKRYSRDSRANKVLAEFWRLAMAEPKRLLLAAIEENAALPGEKR